MNPTDPSAVLTPLCFDRADFSRSNFSVENFLLKARRRGNSFEEIRNDLRVFLKIIQNSMIELINKDYADFVHLSANLAGLRSSVEKLNNETNDLVKDFDDVSTKIQQTVNGLTSKFEEKTTLANQQRNLHVKMAAYQKLNRLKMLLHRICSGQLTSLDFLDRINFQVVDLKVLLTSHKEQLDDRFRADFSHCMDKYQKTLERLLVESTKSSHSPKVAEYISKTLVSFDVCGRMDSAHAIFLSEFVDAEVSKILATKKTEKVALLGQVLQCLLQLRQRYSPYFSVSANSHSFLSDCLLTALLSCLDDKLSSLLFPTDPNVFRKSFLTMTTFMQAWADQRPAIGQLEEQKLDVASANHQNDVQRSGNLVRMIFNKFNIGVYYQMRKQDVLSKIDKAFETKKRLLEKSADGFVLHSMLVLFDCVKLVWSNDEVESVFLPPLTSKCVELTFLLLNRFEHFLGNLSLEFTTAKSATNGTVDGPANQQTPKSHVQLLDVGYLISIASDVHSFQMVFNDFYKRVISAKFTSTLVGEDLERMKSMDLCVEETFQKLRVRGDRLMTETVRDVLVQQVTSHLLAVGEIPRQYRWTRKEAPVQSSTYVNNAFAPIRDFLTETHDFSSEEQVIGVVSSVLATVVQMYSFEIRNVIESVDKISSSLNKLKRGGKGSTANVVDASATSDDDKIRMQLSYDVKEFSKLVSSLQLPKDVCDMNVLEELVNAKSYIVE